MGRSTEAHPEQLVWDLLKAGFTTPCYDGQPFFDTDHPVLNAAGEEVSVSNSGGGAGPAWFLVDDTRALKPIIFQERKKPEFVAKDNPDDETVFWKKEFVYGTDARYNVGYGFWQFIFGSRQPLTVENYAAAREAMLTLRGDYGRPLGIRPTALIVSGENEGAGLRIINNERRPNGESNEYKGTARLEVVTWL